MRNGYCTGLSSESLAKRFFLNSAEYSLCNISRSLSIQMGRLIFLDNLMVHLSEKQFDLKVKRKTVIAKILRGPLLMRHPLVW
jgi:hypothetical protein